MSGFAFRRRRPIPGDCAFVADRLRGWDRIECALAAVDPEAHMREAITFPGFGNAWALEGDRGYAEAIGGVSEVTDMPVTEGQRIGVIWMLGTGALTYYKRAFMDASKEAFPYMVEGFDYVENYVPTARTESLRWLAFLGFDFGPAFMHDTGVMVTPFWWSRHADGPTNAEGPP